MIAAMRGSSVLMVGLGVMALGVIAFLRITTCRFDQPFSFKNDSGEAVRVTPIRAQAGRIEPVMRSGLLQSGFAIAPGERLGLAVPLGVLVDAAIVEYPDGDVRVIAAEPWKRAGDNLIEGRASQRSASADERATIGVARVVRLAPLTTTFVAQPLNIQLIKRLL